MKSICQNLNGPLDNLKCLGAVRTGFPELYFGEVGQVEVGTFCSLIISPSILIHECDHFVSGPMVEYMYSS